MQINGVCSYNSNGSKAMVKNQAFKGFKDFRHPLKSLSNDLKIVFSDIDGTLSASDDYLSEKTVEAIEYLHKNKIPVVLTTARCYKDTLPIIKQLKHYPDYTIVLQGGGLVNKDGEYIFNNSISPKAGKGLVKWFKSIRKDDKNSHLIMYFNEQPYATSKIQFPWQTDLQVKNILSFDTLFNKESELKKAIIYKTNAHQAQGSYSQNKIVDSFYAADVKDLDIKPSGASIIEFQNKWATKDKAINFLLRVLKIEPKNSMVIGDSSNDIEMFDFVRKHDGLAVAMGNADNFVKQHANAVTADVKQDGFFQAVKGLFAKQ